MCIVDGGGGINGGRLKWINALHDVGHVSALLLNIKRLFSSSNLYQVIHYFVIMATSPVPAGGRE